MKKEKLLKYENKKLKNQLIFTLPATQEVCGRQCPGCFAIKAQVTYKNTLPYRERMLSRSKHPDFIADISYEIKAFSKNLDAVRVHESGEFYSQEYINKWVTIAQQNPTVNFYTFTKRFSDFDFTALRSQPNFTVIDSLHHGSLNYDKPLELLKSAISGKFSPMPFLCPATTGESSICDAACGYCWSKRAEQTGLIFIKH